MVTLLLLPRIYGGCDLSFGQKTLSWANILCCRSGQLWQLVPCIKSILYSNGHSCFDLHWIAIISFSALISFSWKEPTNPQTGYKVVSLISAIMICPDSVWNQSFRFGEIEEQRSSTFQVSFSSAEADARIKCLCCRVVSFPDPLAFEWGGEPV